jgi:hypothetical protein
MILDTEKMFRDLKTILATTESLSKESSLTTPSPEELMGLQFKRGEEVIDRATGKRGEIIAGQRAYFSV